MANLPADLPTNWTQGQIISPNGTEAGLTEQHGYNYLNQQVNATQTEVNNLSTKVAGAASQTSVDNIASTIGTTTDSGATSTTGTLMGKVNATLDILGGLTVQCVKSIQRGTASEDDETSQIAISISTVDPLKCMVLLDNGNVNYEGSVGDNLPGSRVVSLTSNTLKITNQYIRYDFSTSGIGWQVIEFY